MIPCGDFFDFTYYFEIHLMVSLNHRSNFECRLSVFLVSFSFQKRNFVIVLYKCIDLENLCEIKNNRLKRTFERKRINELIQSQNELTNLVDIYLH